MFHSLDSELLDHQLLAFLAPSIVFCAAYLDTGYIGIYALDCWILLVINSTSAALKSLNALQTLLPGDQWKNYWETFYKNATYFTALVSCSSKPLWVFSINQFYYYKFSSIILLFYISSIIIILLNYRNITIPYNWLYQTPKLHILTIKLKYNGFYHINSY